MTPSGLTAAVAKVLLALAVFVFVPMSAVFAVERPGIVAYEYARPEIPPSDRYDAASRFELAEATVRWLVSHQSIDVLAQLQHDGEVVYNQRELRHLLDARGLLEGLRWAWRAAALVLLAGLALAVWRPAWRRTVAGGTLLGSGLLVGLLGATLVTALLNFDWFFTQFHYIFFSGNSGFFDYEDSLIQFYPVEFWMHLTWLVGAATAVGGMLIGALSYFTLGRPR